MERVKEKKINILWGALYLIVIAVLVTMAILGGVLLVDNLSDSIGLKNGVLPSSLIETTFLFAIAVSFVLNVRVLKDRGEYHGRGVVLGAIACAGVWLSLFLSN